VSKDNPVDKIPFFALNMPEWGRWLAGTLGRDLAEVYRPEDNSVWTTLVRADGSPNFMPLDQFPYGSDFRSGWA
jgi:hypothetical protein